jgi:Flp pilus assembly pilin Flp
MPRQHSESLSEKPSGSAGEPFLSIPARWAFCAHGAGFLT